MYSTSVLPSDRPWSVPGQTVFEHAKTSPERCAIRDASPLSASHRRNRSPNPLRLFTERSGWSRPSMSSWLATSQRMSSAIVLEFIAGRQRINTAPRRNLPSFRYVVLGYVDLRITANLIFSKLRPLMPVLFSRRTFVSEKGSCCMILVST